MPSSKKNRASVSKGKSGEREVAKIFRAAGYTADRAGQYQSGGWAPRGLDIGDVVVKELPSLHLEVKRREKIDIHEFVAQAEKDCKKREPVVIYRRSRTKWRAVISLDFFIRLLRMADFDRDTVLGKRLDEIADELIKERGDGESQGTDNG